MTWLTVHSLQKKPTYSCTWTEFTDIMYTDMELSGTNNTSHDKGFLAVKAGSQIIFGDAFSDNTVYAGNIDAKLGGTYDTPNTASKNFDAPWQWEKLRKVNYFLNHYAEVGDPETLKKYAAQAYSSRHGTITSNWWLWVKCLGG